VDFRVDPSLPTPPCRQIVEAVLDAVASGRLGVRDRLPSVRGMAASALVNPNTVGKAYRELEVLGVVTTRSGDGVFVADAGPDVARAERGHATLEALRAAARMARRAGHDPAVIEEAVRREVSTEVARERSAKEAS
jgi:GntR family transcriptional regulator